MGKQSGEPSEAKYLFHVFGDERFIDLNLYQFGWEKCEPAHMFGPAIRNHFLFHFIVSGKGKLDGSGQTFELHGGQGFILFPGQLSTYYADIEEPWEYLWLEFDGLRARESITLAGMSEVEPVYTPVGAGAEAEICRLMRYIVDHPADPPMRLVSYGMLLLVELVQDSVRQLRPNKRRLVDFYMREAVNFLNGNYQSDISVEDIAAACGLNRAYFGRLFKQTMGETPQQFLLHYRMAKAAELLRGSQLSVHEIGALVGYENPFHFSRAFKGVFGSAPAEYRRNHFHL